MARANGAAAKSAHRLRQTGKLRLKSMGTGYIDPAVGSPSRRLPSREFQERRIRGFALFAVNLPPVPDGQRENYQLGIANVTQDSIVADTITPVLAKLFAFEGVAQAARVIGCCQPLAENLRTRRAI